MTAARGTRDSQDAEDFDVEEALALVKKDGAPAPEGRSVPAPAPEPSSRDAGPPTPITRPPLARGPRRRRAGRPFRATPGPCLRTPRRLPRPRPRRPLAALTDLPSFDTSAMDGWAVAGPGPWEVREEGVLAGHAEPAALTDGEAVRIATGARIPQDVTAVLRSEHGLIDDKGRLHAIREVVHGQDIRPRGQECRSGDQLLPAGALVTPAVLGLAAAAGYDTLAAVPRPRAEVLVLGDELLTQGLPQDGLIRDALGPMLPPWLRALGAEVVAVRRLRDDAKALHKAITGSDADLIVTTGGTAAGPVDHVHPTLRRIGAELLVDGVKVRPGHPMLLARTKENQHLVGLPGNPLAAVSGLLTLAEPLLRILAGRPAPGRTRCPSTRPCTGTPTTPGSSPSRCAPTGRCRCTTTARRCCGASRRPTRSRSYRRAVRGRGRSWNSSICPGPPQGSTSASHDLERGAGRMKMRVG